MDYPVPGDRIIDLDGEYGRLLGVDKEECDLEDEYSCQVFEPAIIFVVERTDFSVDEIIYYRSDGRLPIRKVPDETPNEELA